MNKKQFSASAYVRKAVHEYRDAPAHRGGGTQALSVLAVEPGSVAERIGLKPATKFTGSMGSPCSM